DTAVLRAAVAGLIRRERLGAAITDRREAVRRQAGPNEMVDHGLRPLLRQRLVRGLFTLGIRVAGDLDIGGRTAERNLDQAVKQTGGVTVDVGTAGLEADRGLSKQIGEQLLADGRIDRRGLRLHRDLGLDLP